MAAVVIFRGPPVDDFVYGEINYQMIKISNPLLTGLTVGCLSAFSNVRYLQKNMGCTKNCLLWKRDSVTLKIIK